MLEYFIKPQMHMALRWLFLTREGDCGASRISKQNGGELCTGCRMAKITMEITRLWENLRRDDRLIELY